MMLYIQNKKPWYYQFDKSIYMNMTFASKIYKIRARLCKLQTRNVCITKYARLYKLSNDPVVKNYMYSISDLDL
jgi:hypothetical protein